MESNLSNGRISNRLKIKVAEKEIRDHRKYTYRNIAEAIGVSTSTLVKWNKDEVETISAVTLSAFCKWLDCQPGDLLTWIPEQENKVKRVKRRR